MSSNCLQFLSEDITAKPKFSAITGGTGSVGLALVKHLGSRSKKVKLLTAPELLPDKAVDLALKAVVRRAPAQKAASSAFPAFFCCFPAAAGCRGKM